MHIWDSTPVSIMFISPSDFSACIKGSTAQQLKSVFSIGAVLGSAFFISGRVVPIIFEQCSVTTIGILKSFAR
ncbi:hypothetical protein BMS3Abin09_00460 [bacterium BMS3Abin09]|nr:hypothetical protein BMS3Abin09_00460 [bacterium BMS3Abin09]